MENSDKQTRTKKNIHSELVKISFNIPIKLNDKIKTYSNEVGLNYTSTLVYLLQCAIESKDYDNAIKNFCATFECNEENALNLYKATRSRL